LLAEARGRITAGRVDNPFLKRLMLAVGAQLMFMNRDMHEADALAAAARDKAEALDDAAKMAVRERAEQEIKAARERDQALAAQAAATEARTAEMHWRRASTAGKGRLGKRPSLEPAIAGMRKLELTVIELGNRTGKELMEVLAAQGAIVVTDDNQKTMLQRVVRARQELIKRQLAEADAAKN
jgi:hypothetical protein